MQRYSLLPGTSSLCQTALSRSAVERDTSSPLQSVSSVSGGVSSKVKCPLTSSQNCGLLGHVGVKDEIRCSTVVKSAGLKEASVVNTEYMQIGLVICSGSHSHCHSHTFSHGNVKLM